jgi:hypothetical protein
MTLTGELEAVHVEFQLTAEIKEEADKATLEDLPLLNEGVHSAMPLLEEGTVHQEPLILELQAPSGVR